MDVKELLGITLGTCTIERIIGRGGMGAVYLAQQLRPVRTVAVKVLIPSDMTDPEQQRIFLERFRREADTVAKLEHKNILPIYEYDEDVVDGQRLAYLVMPYIRGGTLRERMNEMKLAGRQFEMNTVVSYINQVADALNYAHSLGVVHRDIKPGNLLFHQDGRLLLSDFGIVRLKAMPALTSVGSFLGTAEYASPEQVRAGELDTRSDIYSLGIILYELLTGNVPFTGSNPFVVMSKQLNDPVPSFRNVRPDLSPAIDFVVKKALAKNPEDRYQSASEMATDLQLAVLRPSTSAGLRLTGDANNNDLTIPERPPITFKVSSPAEGVVPGAGGLSEFSGGAIPPTVGVQSVAPGPTRPPGGASWQSAESINPQYSSPVKAQQIFSSPPYNPTQPAAFHTPTTGGTTYRQERRLFYYSVAMAGLLTQLLVFVLLFASSRQPRISSPALESSAVLGILLSSAINLLALAAIVFTGVLRSRFGHGRLNRNFYSCLSTVLVAPILSGLFINFGSGSHSFLASLGAYLVLLLSNIFAIRQLGLVDAPGEQIEVAPVLWRPAILSSLTGLLPLTIILIFALTAAPAFGFAAPTLLKFFAVLLIAILGAPTPGAMLAIWQSRKMTFPVLLRSSAMAGLIMFLSAFLFVIVWSLLLSNRTLIFYHFSQIWIAVGVVASLLGLIGMLRGMLDAWIFQRITKKSS